MTVPSSSHHWIVETTSVDQFTVDMSDVDIPIDSNVLVFSKVGDTIELFDVYKPDPGADLRITGWGDWSKESGLSVSKTEKWELRRDLTGVYFTTSTAHDPPYVDVRDVDINNLPPGYKLDIKSSPVYIGPSLYGDIWLNLQQSLNFSYNMIYSVDGGWGAKQDDGNFSGIVGIHKQ